MFIDKGKFFSFRKSGSGPDNRGQDLLTSDVILVSRSLRCVGFSGVSKSINNQNCLNLKPDDNQIT